MKYCLLPKVTLSKTVGLHITSAFTRKVYSEACVSLKNAKPISSISDLKGQDSKTLFQVVSNDEIIVVSISSRLSDRMNY